MSSLIRFHRLLLAGIAATADGPGFAAGGTSNGTR
jgi:hypothetical protein